MAATTITMLNALKAVQSGLSSKSSATTSQTIMLFGSDGTPNGKVPLSTQAVIDLNSGQTLADIIEYLKPVPYNDYYVDMGLPSKVLWARRNVDVTQSNGFTASEYQYECSFFSFGNTDPHNPTSTSSFSPYSWGSSNDGSPYSATPGASISYPASAGPSYDAARAVCGAPWRLPSTEEFAELFSNSNYIDANGNTISSSTTNKLITMNGITGIRLKSKINGNVLFFPCSGYGKGSSWSDRGSYGVYWSRSLFSAAYGRLLSFSSSGVYPQNYNGRFYGFAVRPVQ